MFLGNNMWQLTGSPDVSCTTELRQQVLQTPHAAHQGVTGKYKPHQDWGLVQDDRNRRFVRVILPPLRRGAVNQDAQLLNHSPGDDDDDGDDRDDDDDDDDYYHHVQQQGRQDPPAVTECQEPQTEEHVLPQHTPQAQESLKPGLQRDQLPEVPHTPQAGVGDPQQQNGHYHCHYVEEDTPPQGPCKVGPPEPYSEASQKQTHFVSEQTSTFPHSTVYGKPGLNYKTYQAETLENQ